MSIKSRPKIKRFLWWAAIFLLLAGCGGPTDKEVGQSALSVTPAVFLISMGFQYLFFRMWKIKWPDLTLAWLPNFIFFIILALIASILGKAESLIASLHIQSALFIFGSSYLTTLLIVTRIWLFFNHSKTFTWVSILTMTLYILPAFPMVAGLTKGTSFVGTFVFPLWLFPGSLLFQTPGLLTALIFFALLFEVWFRTRKKPVA